MSDIANLHMSLLLDPLLAKESISDVKTYSPKLPLLTPDKSALKKKQH